MQQFLVFVSEFPRSVGLVPLSNPNNIQNGPPLQPTTFLSISSVGDARKCKTLLKIKLLDIASDLKTYERLDIDPIYGIAGIIEDEDEIYLVLISRAVPVRDNLHSIYKVQRTRLLSLRTGEFDYTDEDMTFDQINSQNKNDDVYNYDFLNQTQSVDGEYKSAFKPVYDRKIIEPYLDHKIKQKHSFPHLNNDNSAKLVDYLEKANLFFSQSYDLTRSAQEQKLLQQQFQHMQSNNNNPDINTHSKLDFLCFFKSNKFRWNNFMLESFNQFERKLGIGSDLEAFRQSNYIINLIQGYVGCFSKPPDLGSNDVLTFMVISRLSADRIGTRFLTRGIDDRGNVANSAETEVIIFSNFWTLSYVQIRGMFWTQLGLQLGAHKARLTRSIDASLPAAKKHFEEIITRYGTVHIVNLVKGIGYEGYAPPKVFLDSINSGNSFGELELGISFDNLVKKLKLPELIGFTSFDYHQEVRGGQYDNISSLINVLIPVIQRQKFFFKRHNADGSNEIVESWQFGVFRVNCLDCLDRTNIVQSEIVRYVFSIVLLERLSIELQINPSAVNSILTQLLVESGNALSMLYAGSLALKTGVTATGKSGISGFFSDASKTIGRFVQNNFSDKNKQAMIDTMVGNKQNSLTSKRFFYFDDQFETFKSQLVYFKNANTIKKEIRIFTSTFNAAGYGYNGQSLESWLGAIIQQRSNVVMLSMQEIVALNVSSIISADTTNKMVWIQTILQFLNSRRKEGDDEYVLIASEQLVGISLILIVERSIVDLVMNVYFTKIKTGLGGGLSGNKGAICLKYNLGTKVGVCFVGAHLSSGTNKVIDRNYDYNTINNGIPMSEADDITIWAGDLNYRLELPTINDVEEMLSEGNVRSLMLYDQLTQQINNGAVFQDDFFEIPIQFRPTYKFQIGTSEYNNQSDPPRIPSYTDRILYKVGSKINGFKATEYYSCEEIGSSDHKPVVSLSVLEIQVDKIEVNFPNSHLISKLARYSVQKMSKNVKC
ncbi:hypothetical protein BB561_000942 [Smittium simulii]|uniref:phosphoinositide 5-phosphatase n=1 Tax=Smittium simulii TaxID=133385 RepID=A0A2T9YX19_9FUNG|nr:hypothetical protein BB561_000942 [Smittium simulii]